jgi:hypothetical protein
MSSCLCQGAGRYKVTRYAALLNEYRIVEKDCDCRGENVLGSGRIDGATRRLHTSMPPLNTAREQRTRAMPSQSLPDTNFRP